MKGWKVQNLAASSEKLVKANMVSGSVIIDARNHMLGRVASIIAKELLKGNKVVAVRSEEICISGGLVRQKMKYMRFLRKRMNTKPSHGPIHFRAPAKILWRTIRGFASHRINTTQSLSFFLSFFLSLIYNMSFDYYYYYYYL